MQIWYSFLLFILVIRAVLAQNFVGIVIVKKQHPEVLRSLCVCYRTFLLTLIFILTKPLGCICTRMLIILVLLISWLTWLSIRQSHLIGIRKQTSCSFIHSTHFYTMVHVGDAGDETHGSEHFSSKFNPFIKLGLEWFENSGWCLTFEGWMTGHF